MRIIVTCTNCDAKAQAPESVIRKKAKYTKCGTVFVVSKAPSEQSNEEN